MLVPMDREKLQQYLQEAERNVAESTMHVVERNALVVRLERDGWDTANARQLLKLFEESRALYLAERDRLRRELEYSPSIQAPEVKSPSSAAEE